MIIAKKPSEPKHRSAVTLREFAEQNQAFRSACDRAGVQPTRRQAAKWHQGRGSAYANRHAPQGGETDETNQQ